MNANETASGGGALILLLMAVVVIILMGVALPPINEHAIVRHDDDAWTAYNHVQNNGNEWHCWKCADGRLRYVCPISGPKAVFAVVVLEPTFQLVTAFTCDQDYAKGITGNEKNFNPWHDPHP